MRRPVPRPPARLRGGTRPAGDETGSPARPPRPGAAAARPAPAEEAEQASFEAEDEEEAREFTPREIVAELDKFVIGQTGAKRAVAIALRNRWRRWRIDEDIRDEIAPNNIILIGTTGVGKTEIARRLARLAQAPFIKVEASKFTEVGYVGRDVESMIRDLVEISVNMVRSERTAEVEDEAWDQVDERLLDLLLPPPRREAGEEGQAADREVEARHKETREKLKKQLLDGKLESRWVEVEITAQRQPSLEIFSNQPFDELESNLQELLSNVLPPRRRRRRVTVAEARELLFQEEVGKLLDMDKVISEAMDRAENTGIVFIDEIDKIVAPAGDARSGPDISREGVQRDLLPVVEGSNVPTKYGMIRTEHVLFIAAGAFHHAKPSDLIPELQGRFPIRVELSSLTEEDFVRILREPEHALLRQYQALMKSDGVELSFDEDGVREVARIASAINHEMENIGARRLHTVLTTLLEDILFDVPDRAAKEIRVTLDYVRQKLSPILESPDLTRYIL